jgi:uncharacterized protein (DUF1697 family)
MLLSSKKLLHFINHLMIQTSCSLLRGINVSGTKKILMADLKALYEALNLQNVKTYIQSGNVVFQHAPEETETLAPRIGAAILAQYGFDVPIVIRSASEVEAVLHANPFLKREGIELTQLHVSFLSEAPDPQRIGVLKEANIGADEWEIVGKEVYILCNNGYGNTKLSNGFLESKLKVQATTRNWKTVQTLNEMLSVK